jgi:hypothetical protein
MSDARILYPQFRDEQEDSRYPFADNATLVSVERKLDIGRDTFFDASVYAVGAAYGVYISAITVAATEITIQLGDSSTKKLATATFNPLSIPADGVLELIDIYGRPAGTLLSTAFLLARFVAWPLETHTFTATAAAFVASVVIPAQEPGLRGIQCENGDLLTRAVWLVGDRGIVLRKEGATTIRVDIVGEPLFSRHVCEPIGKFTPKTFLQTITANGISCGPDAYGNFVLTATGYAADDTVLRVYTQDGNLKIDTVGRKVV